MEITYKDKRELQPIYVVKGLKTNLLGLPAITALGLATHVDATIEANPKTELLAKFPGIFQVLGKLGKEYETYLKPDARPNSLFTPQHVPLPLRQRVREELNRMEYQSELSPKWMSRLCGVHGWLWCQRRKEPFASVDLKPLNENMLREVHPLPRVDETQAQLAGAKIFSKLDVNSGFGEKPLAKRSRLLTTLLLASVTIALVRCLSVSLAHRNISRIE